MEAKIKYHVLTCKTRVSTKLVRIKQNPPLCLQRTPRGTQGFGKAGIFCLSAYVRRSIQRDKPFPAMAVSRKTSNKIPIAKQMKGCIIFRDSRHSFFFCVAHKRHHIKVSPAWYALRVGGRETVSTKNAYFCYRNFDVCALFKTVQAFSDLLWLELN